MIHSGRILAVLLLALFLLACPRAAAEDKAKDEKPKFTNRLAKESSPYLLQHAHNPVEWYPWGPEAFEKAKKEGKLVFLSIGYSACHWCHVMEKESFASPEIAKLMNQWFVCIKVDREERPDIDQIYMNALHVFGQRGGWPLSMWLTAEGKPIIGGTYWPPDDKEIDGEKVHGFKTIMKIIHDLHKEKPKDLQEQADKVAAATANALAGINRGVALVELNRELVASATDGLKDEFDKVYGGFGNPQRNFRGTKFPVPPYLRLLQHEAARTKAKGLAEIVQVTLDNMARGGIYDHLGGGFHRYSTERTWTVPHFEKMLYDNAQLAELYALAYRHNGNPLFRRTLLETLQFVRRELMADDAPRFYSALDADSEGEEGRFYVWTARELDDVLGKADADLVRQVYSKDGNANFESKYYILHLPTPLADKAKELKRPEEELEKQLAPLRKKLFEARGKRPRCFLDTKTITGWSGQMIAGLALAAQVLKQEEKAKDGASTEWLKLAQDSADFILKNLRTKDGRLLRIYAARPGEKPEARLNGCLDDYAFFVHGLLNLHDATGDQKWLDEAKALTDKTVELFLDKERGGFFYTSHDHEKLFARAKDQHDGAQPSGNSVAARNLVRLWLKTGEARYRDLGEKTIKSFAAQLKTSASGLTTMAEALALFLDAQEKEKKK